MARLPNVPRWRGHRDLRPTEIPTGLRDWLCEQRSLTRRLRLQCPAPFSLELLSQRWERPLADERLALKIRPGRLTLVRQVRMLCAGRALVFARSVIPADTLRGRPGRLAHLGTRPLADMLFTEGGVKRGEMEFALLGPGAPLCGLTIQALNTEPHGLWARRSLFLIRRKPLLVSEVFLPEIGDAEA